MTRIRWPIAIWLIILIVIALRISFAARTNSVYPIFRAAGQKWLTGEYVYIPPTDRLDVFRYSPLVAAFFAPWSLVPDRVAEIAWRLLNAGIFFAALIVWARYWMLKQHVAATLLIVLPLTIGGLNNGQCNALAAGLLLLAQVAFARQRWNLAAALISIAVLIKGYPLALGLLFCIIEPRRFTPRLAAFLAIGAALPFLCQRPEYVASQFSAYWQRLCADDRTHFSLDAGYRDLHMLIRRIGIPLTLAGYRAVELILAWAVAGIVVSLRVQGQSRLPIIRDCMSLAIMWMTLAGPATESSTYVLLAPILADSLLGKHHRPAWQQSLVIASFALFLIGAVIVWFPGWLSRPVHAVGLQPFAALLLAASVICDALRGMTIHSETLHLKSDVSHSDSLRLAAFSAVRPSAIQMISKANRA